jgi:hypothetical protein
MDWPTVGTAVLAVLVSGFITHRYWRKQQAYIDSSLLADRKNERRHQAILEALRALAPVLANNALRDTFVSGTFDSLEIDKNDDMKMAIEAYTKTIADGQVFSSAVAALKPRLTRAEIDQLVATLAADDSPLGSDDTRTVLVGLLK